jgi:hypothetical protein
MPNYHERIDRQKNKNRNQDSSDPCNTRRDSTLPSHNAI